MNPNAEQNPRHTAETHIDQITTFLRGIGLAVTFAELPEGTFLPGVELRGAGLIVDREKLLYPGDLLHEAGHLAVMLPERRNASQVDVGTDMGDEIAAQCWSYAAAVHLGLPPAVVFHEHGYRKSAESLMETYRDGLVGVPLLQWMGFTWDAKHAAEHNEPAWPHMRRWLRV